MDGRGAGLQEASLGLQMVNLAKRGTFINDLRAKFCVVRAAVTVELGGTGRNEQQRRSRLALEIHKLNNTAKKNLLIEEMERLEKAGEI